MLGMEAWRVLTGSAQGRLAGSGYGDQEKGDFQPREVCFTL